MTEQLPLFNHPKNISNSEIQPTSLVSRGLKAVKTKSQRITTEQEQKVMPIIVPLMDTAFRKGYYSFKQAASFILDSIRSSFGDEVANEFDLQHLQGAYIAVSGKYQDQVADSFLEVGNVKTIEELNRVPNPNTDHNLSLGRTFDDEIYAKAKPYFIEAVRNLKDAGSDIREVMRALIRLILDQSGPDVVQNMKPYVTQFVRDYQKGEFDVSSTDQHLASDRGYLHQMNKSKESSAQHRRKLMEALNKLTPKERHKLLKDQMIKRGLLKLNGK